MLCGTCTVQIRPRKHVLARADYAAPTLQHESDHTDQESICPAWQSCITNCTEIAHTAHTDHLLADLHHEL